MNNLGLWNLIGSCVLLPKADRLLKMSVKQYKIELPNPCEQNWAGMPRINGGFYCHQCTKVVHDFSTLSDEELIRLISSRKNQGICGRFNTSQLNRNIIINTTPAQSNHRTLSVVIFGLLSLRLFSQNQQISLQPQNTSKLNKVVFTNNQKTPVKVLKGRIFNSKSKKGIAASISVYVSNKDTVCVLKSMADTNGYYSLNLPVKELGYFFKIEFSNTHYQNRQITLKREQIPNQLNVSLLEVQGAPVEVEIVAKAVKLDEGYGVVYRETRVFGGIPALQEDVITYRAGVKGKLTRFWLKVKRKTLRVLNIEY